MNFRFIKTHRFDILKFLRKTFLIYLLYSSSKLWCATYTWDSINAVDNDWKNPSNWTSSDGGTTYPDSGDTAEINAGDTITITISPITVDTLTNNGTIDIGSNTLIINNSYSGTSGTFNLNGGTLYNNTSSALTIDTLNLSTTQSTLQGDFSVTNNISSGNLRTSGNVTLSGTLSSLNVYSGIVTLSGNTTVSSISNSDAINVGTNTLSASSYSGTGTIDLQGGTLKNTGASTITVNTLTLDTSSESALSGNFNISSLTTNGKLKTSGNITLSGTLSSLNINSGTISLSNNTTVNSITNNGTLNAGTHNLNFTSYSGNGSSDKISTTTGTITAENSSAISIGRLNVGTGTFVNKGSAEISVSSCSLNGSTLTNDSSATGNLSISTLSLGTSESTLNGSSTQKIQISNPISAGTSGKLVTNGLVTLGGSLSSLTVNSGTTTTNAASSFTNLSLSGNLSLGNTFQTQDITISTGGKLSANDNNIIVNGNWTNNVGTSGFSSGASGNTITFTGSSKTISGNNNFSNAIFSGTASVTGDNTFESASFNSTTIFSSGTTTTISTAANISANTTFDSLVNNGTVSVGSSKTVSVSSYNDNGTGIMDLQGGTFTNNGTSQITINNISLDSTIESTLNGETGGIVTSISSGKVKTSGLVDITGTPSSLYINSGCTLTLSNDTTVGSITNNGTLNAGTHNLTFTSYSGNGSSDTISTTTGTITSENSSTITIGKLNVGTGTFVNKGSAGISISNCTLNGSTLTNDTSATGNLTISTLSLATSESTLNGSSTQKIQVSNPISAGASGKLVTNGLVTLGGSLSSLTVNSGTTTTNASSSFSNLSLNGELSLGNTFQTQNVTISTGGKLSANNNNITVNGDWTNNIGTSGFSSGVSGNTITFTTNASDSDQISTISGTNTFYNAIFNSEVKLTDTNTFNDVTFYDSTTLDNSNTFHNLTFETNASGNITTQQTVTNYTKILIGSGKTLSLTSSSNSFTNPIVLGSTSTATGTITLNGSNLKIAANANATQLTVQSPVELNGDVRTTNSQEYQDEITIKNNLTLTSNSQTVFSKNINDSGSHTLTLNSITKLADNITFSPAKVIFKNKVDSNSTNHSLTVNNIEFQNTVGSTTPLTTLNVNGTTTISSNASTITTTTSQTFSNKVTLSTDTTLNSPDITFSEEISGSSYKLTLNASGTVKLTTTTLNTINFTDNSSNVEITDAIIQITNRTTLPNNITITGSTFSSISAPQIVFPDSSKNITINKPLTITGYTMLNADITGTETLTINGDTVIKNNTTNSTQIAAELSCSKNLIVYNGKLDIQSNITIAEDFVLFGSAYDEKDQESGLNNIYYYRYKDSNTSARGILPDMGNFAPENGLLPDGNTPVSIPTTSTTNFSAEINTSGTPIIKVGKNFFANGLTATGLTPWGLQLKHNNRSISDFIFANAFNCTFTNCNVTCHESSYSSNPAALKISAEGCTVDGNTNSAPGWDLEDFTIIKAYTVHDNLVYIEFDREVCNTDSIFTNSNNIKRIKFNKDISTNTYGSYINVKKYSDISSQIPNISEPNPSITCYYFIAEDTWNTDATGNYAGDSNSTDTSGNHKTAIPYIDIQRNETGTNSYNYFITDLYGKRLKQYHYTSATVTNGGTRWYNVTDKCSPVLISVKTGQERHKVYNPAIGGNSQNSCDSHNFIEFRYSEPVNFGENTPGKLYIPAETTTGTVISFATPYVAGNIGTKPSLGTSNRSENIQVTTDFGIQTSSTSLTFTGLGKFTNGSLKTGKNGLQENTVNAFYKNNGDTDNQYIDDYHSIRLSIVGYTNGTIPDRSGREFKNWEGYIESAVTPSGTFSLESNTNPLVKDLEGNVQKSSPNPITVGTDPSFINSHNTQNLYGPWDVSPPIFAPTRYHATDETYNTTQYEAVGATTGSTLDRIEFHLFDNTIEFNKNLSQPAYWLTRKGWCNGKTQNLAIPESYCAEEIGGSRPFDTNSTIRTSGGIRLSTKMNCASNFKYTTIENGTPDKTLTTVYETIKSPFFTESSSPRRSNNDPDGLYFGLGLSETDLPVQTKFTITYTPELSNKYLTDLAGNRLVSNKIYSIDRTPPDFDFTVCQINKEDILIVFVKELITDSNSIVFYDNDPSPSQQTITQKYEDIIPSCFELFTITGTTPTSTANSSDPTILKIDTSKPAKIKVISQPNSSSFTTIQLKLNRTVTLEDLQKYYIRLTYSPNYWEFSKDIMSDNIGARVTFIQDQNGNYAQMYTAHAISDFAVNAITPLYAYASDMNDNNTPIMQNLYESNSWAVHDWNENQQNYGTIPANRDISIVTSVTDGTHTNNFPENIHIYFTNAPTPGSVSTQYNKDFPKKLRIWLPDIPNSLFRAIATTNNTNFLSLEGNLLTPQIQDGLIFNISKSITTTWNNNNQISFLFGILDSSNNPVRIYNVPFLDVSNNNYDLTRSTSVPLYCLRLTDPNDLTSLDLWSFKVESITEQRGGITILNNVINPEKGEKTVVKLNMPSDGNLNIMVMTLDGNIIQYLNHGQTTAGEHYYSWNGKNKNGTPVARGMYFVRIVGNGIDETRKVMVVK